MIVADVNLVAYILLQGPDTALAREVYKADSAWAAPPLWRSEFRSVLAAHMRKRGLTLADAWEAHESAERLLGAREAAPEAERVLQLVASSPCSAYDCEYVALAERLRVPLVTGDKELLRAFPKLAVSPGVFVRRRR